MIDYDSNSAACTDSSQVLVAGCSEGYCENVTFEFTKSNTMPSGNTITNAPFDVDSNGAIQLTTALNLDYETLVNANEEIRCNNTGNTMDGSIDPVMALQGSRPRRMKPMVNRISILRHGGAQRLCSRSWRLATKSELTSAWNAGLKKSRLRYHGRHTTTAEKHGRTREMCFMTNRVRMGFLFDSDLYASSVILE